jgi:chaperonin GroEL (HSP60 family)
MSVLARFQIQTAQGEVVITNDGATILKHMAVLHPAARMVRDQLAFSAAASASSSSCQSR